MPKTPIVTMKATILWGFRGFCGFSPGSSTGIDSFRFRCCRKEKHVAGRCGGLDLVSPFPELFGQLFSGSTRTSDRRGEIPETSIQSREGFSAVSGNLCLVSLSSYDHLPAATVAVEPLHLSLPIPRHTSSPAEASSG